MKITVKDTLDVALLARLELTNEDIEMYTKQLDAILEYVAVLDSADTSNVQPTAHVLPLKNVMRKDQIVPSLDRELALANAPVQEDGYFKVPKIMEG